MTIYDLVECMADETLLSANIRKTGTGFIEIKLVARDPKSGHGLVHTYSIHESVPRLGERAMRERLTDESLNAFIEDVRARARAKNGHEAS